MGFPGVSVVKNLPANAGDAGSIPGLGRSPGEGNGDPLWWTEEPSGLQGVGSQRVRHDWGDLAEAAAAYWSGSPFPSPGDLPNPGIKPTSPALASRFFTTEIPGKPMEYYSIIKRNEYESVLVRWMNLEPVIHSEVSQKEKKYCIVMHIYVIYKNGYWWTYLEGRNGDTDVGNRLVDMGGSWG